MKAKTSLLGIAFLAPTLLILSIFFIMPAVLTGVFAFTNISTSTGISNGGYVLTPSTIRDLAARGADNGISAETRARLEGAVYRVDAAGLARAAEAGVAPAFLSQIEARLMDREYPVARDFENALKTLPTRPRAIRELKLAMEYFGSSLINQRFPTQTAAEEALKASLPDIAPDERARILDASYTGWRWTLDNYRRMLGQTETLRIVGNTAFYVVAVLSINVGGGLLLALATFYMPKGAAGAFSLLWLLPRITPVVLYAVLWKWFTWEGGFLPTMLGHLGLPNFNYMKGSVPTAWATVIFVNGFVGASFGMIMFSGALRAIPQQQFWAAEVDGASRLTQIRRIILPQMRWPIMFVTSYQTLSLLASYDIIWLTTNGGPGRTTTVWALEAFHQALSNMTGNLAYGYGAAMALILVIVGLTLSILYLRIFRFGDLVARPRIDF